MNKIHLKELVYECECDSDPKMVTFIHVENLHFLISLSSFPIEYRSDDITKTFFFFNF